MGELHQKLRELEAKAIKYDNMRERYLEYGKKIDAALAILQDLKKQIAPTLKISVRNSSGINFPKLTDEVILEMENGQVVTRKYLEGKFQALERQQITYLMRNIQKRPNVQITRDGNKNKLFLNTG